MSKKTAGGLLGTIIVAGVAVGVAKYLKDYAGASYTKDEEIDRVKDSTARTKEAAKRTYVAIREKGDVKSAAGELAKAAGDVVSDAGSIAKTAGIGAVNAAKTVKDRYAEDPDAAREEMLDNIKEMGQSFVDKAYDVADSVKDKISSMGGDGADGDIYDNDDEGIDCVPYYRASESSFDDDEEEGSEEEETAEDASDDAPEEGCVDDCSAPDEDEASDEGVHKVAIDFVDEDDHSVEIDED